MNASAAILADLLEQAQKGRLTEVFVVFREEGEWHDAYDSADMDDCLFAVETAKIRARIATARGDS